MFAEENKFQSTINQVMVEFTINCMLNPNNKDFYIGTLTLHQIGELINGSSKKADIIWKAFAISSNIYYQNLKKEETL